MNESWERALLEPLATAGTRFLQFLPNLLAAFVILAIGWPLAWALGRGVERALRVLGVDHLADRVGLNAALTRSGLKPDPCHLTGRLFYWSLLVLTVFAALGALDVAAINRATTTLLGYIPYVLTAAVILAVGALLSNYVARSTLIAAVNANVRSATALAGLARWGVLLITLAMALEQLGIAQTIVAVGFGIAFSGIILALALAFGLGARNLAKEALEHQLGLGHRRERSKDELTHL